MPIVSLKGPTLAALLLREDAMCLAMLTRIICLLVSLGASLLSAQSDSARDLPTVSHHGKDSVPRPVWFEENSGQAQDDVAFIGRGFGVPLAVLKNGELLLGPQRGVVRLESTLR